MTERRTALYRLYGEADRLLYVGIAYDPPMRWNWHRGMSPWWPQVVRRTVDWHDSRREAARAEASAVLNEGPVYNKTLPAEDGSPSYKLRYPENHWRLRKKQSPGLPGAKMPKRPDPREATP